MNGHTRVQHVHTNNNAMCYMLNFQSNNVTAIENDKQHVNLKVAMI
jgi:hypothetical protein